MNPSVINGEIRNRGFHFATVVNQNGTKKKGADRADPKAVPLRG